MTPASLRYGQPITRREAQVAIQILFGHTRAEIAQDLGLTLKTVDFYRSQLFHKYGVFNCFGLVRCMLGLDAQAVIAMFAVPDETPAE